MFSRVFHKSKRGRNNKRSKNSFNERAEEQQNALEDPLQNELSDSHERVDADPWQTQKDKQTQTEQEQPPSLPPKKHSVSVLDQQASIGNAAKDAINDSQYFFPRHLTLRSEQGINIEKPNVDNDETSTASEGSPFLAKTTRTQSMSVIPRAKGTPYKQTRKLFSSRKKTNGADFEIKYVRVHGPSDGAYKNQSEPRGFIFIKNFEMFDGNKFGRRSGSAKDYSNLLHLFEQMGYRKCTKCCESGHITKDKFVLDLESFRNLDHQLYDSTIIIIMSHGVKDKTFVTSDNEEVDLLDVYSMFSNNNCEGLKNKPKIFILQFCRPKSALPSTLSSSSLLPLSPDDTIDLRIKEQVELMKVQFRLEMQEFVESAVREAFKNINVTNSPQNLQMTSPLLSALETNKKSSNSLGSTQLLTYEVESLLIDPAPGSTWFDTDALKLANTPSIAFTTDSAPDYSDMYSIFSTNSGGVAYRDPKRGSLLIQAICRVFSSHAFQDDIEELVRKVSKRMQQELSKDDPLGSHRNAVVERVNNGLDKAFYFNPFEIKDRKRYITLG